MPLLANACWHFVAFDFVEDVQATASQLRWVLPLARAAPPMAPRTSVALSVATITLRMLPPFGPDGRRIEARDGASLLSNRGGNRGGYGPWRRLLRRGVSP